jgi:hypothetical protein
MFQVIAFKQAGLVPLSLRKKQQDIKLILKPTLIGGTFVTWLHWRCKDYQKMQGLHIHSVGRDLSVMCGGINPVMFDVCVYGHTILDSNVSSKVFSL